MKKSIIITSLVAALAITATTNLAQARDRHGPHFDFSKVDADGDNQITKAEIIAFQTERFSEADTNGDGSLSAEEATAMMNARAEASNKEKSERRMERMFSRLDENDDNSISLDELMFEDRIDRMFERVDTNEDGAISKEEADDMRAHRGKRHGRGDKNSRS